jgi:hypothetical protein
MSSNDPKRRKEKASSEEVFGYEVSPSEENPVD